jgi:taurine dioxygenase
MINGVEAALNWNGGNYRVRYFPNRKSIKGLRRMSSLNVRNLSDDLAFGARISGLSREATSDPDVRSELNQLFEAHGLLLFEDMDPSTQMQIALSEVFGELKAHPLPTVPLVDPDLAPGILEVASEPENANLIEIDGQQYISWLPWHFDHCYNNELNRGAAIRCIKGVSAGGETGFADGIQLYQSLSSDLRSQIEGTNILYTLNFALCDLRFGLPRNFRELRTHPGARTTLDYAAKLPRAVHPAVWTRQSGEKVLHVSPWMASGIEGREGAEGDALFEAVCQDMIANMRPYFHKWRPTDMIVWDNWRMLHSVTGHSPLEARRMSRTTIKGDYGLGYFEGARQDEAALGLTV